MLLFLIELDEEKIVKDGEISVSAAYKSIDATFAQKDVSLYSIENNVKVYTRQIDYHDFEYLWMVNLAFEEVDWFRKYIKTWRFLDVDEETGEIFEEEDLIEEWEIQ